MTKSVSHTWKHLSSTRVKHTPSAYADELARIRLLRRVNTGTPFIGVTREKGDWLKRGVPVIYFDPAGLPSLMGWRDWAALNTVLEERLHKFMCRAPLRRPDLVSDSRNHEEAVSERIRELEGGRVPLTPPPRCNLCAHISNCGPAVDKASIVRCQDDIGDGVASLGEVCKAILTAPVLSSSPNGPDLSSNHRPAWRSRSRVPLVSNSPKYDPWEGRVFNPPSGHHFLLELVLHTPYRTLVAVTCLCSGYTHLP